MKLHKHAWIISFLIFQSLFASQEVKFGKIAKEDVAQSEHEIYKDAEAAILYKRTFLYYNFDTDNGWNTSMDVFMRIKIYKKEGFERATIHIPLFISGNDKQSISGIKGLTYNLTNGAIAEHKLKKDGIFEENMNKYRNRTSLTMPEIKEGSVIDIKYTIKTPFPSYIPEFAFQDEIPIDKIEVKLKIPEYFTFKKHGKGYFPLKINTERSNRTIRVSWRENLNSTSVITERNSGELDFIETIDEIHATNIPPLLEEPYTNNIDNYRTAIKYELSSSKSFGGKYTTYAQNWNDVAKTIYKWSSFGDELNKSKYYKEDLEQLLAGVNLPNEKISLIFNYVQQKMFWNEYYGVSCDLGVKKAYKENTGNVADINLILVSMLRSAKINANPVLLSTRRHGIPLFPTREGFNYVIAAVEIKDGLILLDATDKYSEPNLLPERDLNWTGRLIRKEGSSASVPLVPSKKSKQAYVLSLKLNEDGSAEGKMRSQLYQQFALNYRKKKLNLDQDEYLETMEKKLGGIEISDFEVRNGKDRGKPIVESCSFFNDTATDVSGNNMYFAPLSFLQLKENPFKLDKREYPVDFSFPRVKRYSVNIQLPEGYSVSELPEAAALSLPENMGGFKYMLRQNGQQLQVVFTLDIKTPIIPSQYYPALKEFYNQLILKQGEQVVLTKA